MTIQSFQEIQERLRAVISLLKSVSVLIGKKQSQPIILKTGESIIPGLDCTKQSALLDLKIGEIEQGIFKVTVVGEFSHGKSTLINALLGESLLPAKSAPATAIATMLVYGDSDRVCVYRTDEVKPITMSWNEFKEKYQLQEDYDIINSDKFKNIKYAKIEKRYKVLANGVKLIDSPGLKEDPIRTKITTDFLQESHAIIFLLNATQLLNEDE